LSSEQVAARLHALAPKGSLLDFLVFRRDSELFGVVKERWFALRYFHGGLARTPRSLCELAWIIGQIEPNQRGAVIRTITVPGPLATIALVFVLYQIVEALGRGAWLEPLPFVVIGALVFRYARHGARFVQSVVRMVASDELGPDRVR
jgi:hypothetical protein